MGTGPFNQHLFKGQPNFQVFFLESVDLTGLVLFKQCKKGSTDISKNNKIDESGAALLDECFRVMSIKARLTSINLKCLQCSRLYIPEFTFTVKVIHT